MKSDSKTLVLGTAIVLAFVTITWVLVTKYPTFRIPISDRWIEFGLVTVLLLTILIAAYPSLHRRPGYWLFLSVLVVVHTVFYTFVFPQVFGKGSPLQTDLWYGAVGGGEFFGFALAIVKIYGVGPKKIKWL